MWVTTIVGLFSVMELHVAFPGHLATCAYWVPLKGIIGHLPLQVGSWPLPHPRFYGASEVAPYAGCLQGVTKGH